MLTHPPAPGKTNVNVLDVFQLTGRRRDAGGSPHDKEKIMVRTAEWIALVLVVVGAVNWGLVGLAQFDLVAALFGGQAAPLSRIVYSLVGVAGVALLALRTRGEMTHAAAIR
jgi:uncharacterized membrane protein YuzA (DUF378 family)